MDKERLLSSGLLEQYVLGLTDEEESEEVERYLKIYPDLQAEVQAMRKAIEQYALQQSIPPPPHGKTAITSKVGTTSRLKRKKTGMPRSSQATLPYRWRLPLAAGFALLFGAIAFLLYRQNEKANYAYRKLTAEFAILRETCDAREQQIANLEQLYAFLRHSDTQPVHLTGTPISPAAEVIVYWNAEQHQAYLNPINLPPPPPGKQYQVWADVAGEMIDIGLLAPAGTHLQAITFVENAESLNITLEPAGGNPVPSVEFLSLHGTI